MEKGRFSLKYFAVAVAMSSSVFAAVATGGSISSGSGVTYGSDAIASEVGYSSAVGINAVASEVGYSSAVGINAKATGYATGNYPVPDFGVTPKVEHSSSGPTPMFLYLPKPFLIMRY